MTSTDYQRKVENTFKIQAHECLIMQLHSVMNLNSAAGDAAKLVSRIYEDLPTTECNALLKETLADCIYALAEACCSVGCSIDDIMDISIEKLKTKYPKINHS